MPLYEYRCDLCDHRTEKLCKVDDPPPVCTACDETLPGETPYMTKVISVTSFRLVGGGWAADGYSRSG